MRTKKGKMHVTTILFSVLTLIIQYISFSYLNTVYGFTVSIFSALLLTHLLICFYKRYDACFFYLFETLLLEGDIFLALHYHITNIPNYNKGFVIPLLIISTSIIVLYCTITYLRDTKSKFYYYRKFFILLSILFFIFYGALFGYHFYLNCTDSILTNSTKHQYYFVPFYTISNHIENYVLHKTSLYSLARYSVIVILFFIPIGFYGKIIIHKLNGIYKFFYTIGIPLIVEITQGFLKVGCFNIDDILLAAFGILLGQLCYFILNSIFLLVKDEEFLFERRTYSYFTRSYWNY